jgi:hypothetical protein
VISITLDYIRPVHVSLLVAGLLTVTLPGCGGSDGCDAPLADAVAYGVHLESASVTWALDAIPLHAAAVASETPAIGDCQSETYPGHVPSPANPITCQWPHIIDIFLDCLVTAENPTPPVTRDYRVRWRFSFEIYDDPRTWIAGDVVAPTAHLGEQYPAYLWDTPGCYPPASTGALRELPLVVEEAVGGPADYPQMVTPDYRRVFRLDFAETEPLGACGGTATMTMSLRLAQTPADFSLVALPCYLCK